MHDLFVVSGRIDDTGNANGCTITQEDFSIQARNNNLIFRIPTPVFGDGLIEQIPDSGIIANQAAAAQQKAYIGIYGRPHRIRMDSGTTNMNGNDDTIARFGWKAQNKSLILFAGEAYNVEMGISNELFQTERDETDNCQFAPTPNDVTNTGGATPDEFRTAPLWGLGQRIFLLHDGRTTDLVQAILAHRSAGTTQFKASEANRVVSNFNLLSDAQKQDLLNFLRSL